MTVGALRIIPAYAGQIGGKKQFYFGEWDHPRIRGTNLPYRHLHRYPVGSSPHTRDKCFSNLIICRKAGIIPAYAGQIHFGFFKSTSRRDHPRIRGTNNLRKRNTIFS